MSNNESTTKELLPDVKAYFDAKANAKKVYDEGMEKIHRDPRFQIGVLEDIFQDNVQAKRREAQRERKVLDSAYYDAPAQAWRDHLKTSENPMVRWIADNAQHYQDHADEILKLLPAGRDELDAYAASRGWCREWTLLANAAEAAGVFPPDTTPPALRDLRAYARRNFRQDRLAGLMRRVNAAITEAVEAAKVEWLASLPEAQEAPASVTLADENPPANER